MKANGYRADDLARVGLVTYERWVMRLWMPILGESHRRVLFDHLFSAAVDDERIVKNP